MGIKEIRFGYLFDGGYWKIYRPFADKKKKWISNVPLTTVIGLENLCIGHNALVVKSLKDYMVCLKVYPYTCYVQNESISAFTDETVEYINTHSKDVFWDASSNTLSIPANHPHYQRQSFVHLNNRNLA